MKKSDLKTGMRIYVKFSSLKSFDERFGIVFPDVDIVIFKDGGYDNLSYITRPITKVWECLEDKHLLNFEYEGILLWERKEEKIILTLDNIEYSESTLRSIIKNSHK